MARLIHLVWLTSSCLLCLQACDTGEVKIPVEYTGPVSEFQNIESYYTESGVLKTKLEAPIVQEFVNGDREFNKGLHVEFYNDQGQLESTLDANHAFYFKEKNQWRGRGKVQVKNIANKEQLNTEELFWMPAEQKIFTDKFVTIRQEGDVIYGKGLDAKQDMSDYTIHEPYGEFDVEEGEENEKEEKVKSKDRPELKERPRRRSRP